ncbi:aromatic acid/H+ symport family MFS transporter [Dietzia sp. CH92]|uniref:MFS transporter n=1 Tax=Dietzia sp. CH92 TaxID=3051823 RepID=UPI0028D5A17C|nr:aromatic acid/H+ symport family MFS transporter [Dietzia sp. CH92]
MKSATRPGTGTPPTAGRSAAFVAALCWIAVLLDGFDLVVLGAIMPALTDPDSAYFNTDAGTATAISVAGLVGMTIGALTIGTLTDRLGRRKLLILSVAGFSALTFVTAFVDTAFLFGALRFLAGIGLGGCLPTCIAMVTEFTRTTKAGSATTTVMTGYHVGAVATAALALVLLQPFGWPAMFVAGAVPALVLVPLMIRYLPESPSYLWAQGRRDEALEIANAYGLETDHLVEREDDLAASGTAGQRPPGIASLFRGPYLRTSVAILVTSFMGLLLVYGLNTWLPKLMQNSGYDLGNSLAFLLVLNVGAVAGLLVAGRVADRIGPRTAGLIWFSAGAVFLALLSIRLPLAGIYVMVFLTGCFVFSSQVLVYAFTSTRYPAAIRATALGMSAGFGRIGAITGPTLGGVLLAAGLGHPWGFYAFAVVGVLGAIALSVTTIAPDRSASPAASVDRG